MLGIDNIQVFKVHINGIFKGDDSVVQIGGVWLIDYANVITMKIGDTVGSYTLTAINNRVDKSNVGSYVFLYNSSLPNADFDASPISGNVPLNVSFTDKSTGSPTSWYWDFGDGNKSSDQNPTHTYVKAGDYFVTLNVTNFYGTATNYSTITVENDQSQTEPTPIEQSQPITTEKNYSSTVTPTVQKEEPSLFQNPLVKVLLDNFSTIICGAIATVLGAIIYDKMKRQHS